MDFVIFTPDELRVGLGALRAIVPELSVRQGHYLETIARLHGVSLRARDLVPALAQTAASTIVDPHRRGRLVQLGIIMTMVDEVVSREAARALEELARALEVREPALSTLQLLASKRGLATRVQVMRRIMGRLMRKTLREQGAGAAYDIFARLFGLAGVDRATVARYAALESYAEGSLGREFYRYIRSNGFSLPGAKGGIPESLMFHDIGHVLSGYATNPAGEIQQAAFQAGFVRTDGFAFLFFGVIQFHLGFKMTPVAEAEVGYFDIEKVMTALARGAELRDDLSDGWDIWAHAQKPLSQVRAELGMQTAVPAEAAAVSATGLQTHADGCAC
jgi:hypothetical protein